MATRLHMGGWCYGCSPPLPRVLTSTLALESRPMQPGTRVTLLRDVRRRGRVVVARGAVGTVSTVSQPGTFAPRALVLFDSTYAVVYLSCLDVASTAS